LLFLFADRCTSERRLAAMSPSRSTERSIASGNAQVTTKMRQKTKKEKKEVTEMMTTRTGTRMKRKNKEDIVMMKTRTRTRMKVEKREENKTRTKHRKKKMHYE
jgi:hypothetical protein